MLNDRETKLAAAMLTSHAAHLATAGCNDWAPPTDWTHMQRQDFAREFYAWAGTPEDFDPMNPSLQDDQVARFLAHRMQNPSRAYVVRASQATAHYLAGYLTPTQWEKLQLWAQGRPGPYQISFSPTGIGTAVNTTAADGAKHDLAESEYW